MRRHYFLFFGETNCMKKNNKKSVNDSNDTTIYGVTLLDLDDAFAIFSLIFPFI